MRSATLIDTVPSNAPALDRAVGVRRVEVPSYETLGLPSTGETETRAPALAVRDLVKRYGDFTAVKGISFAVRQGEIFGLLGPNGAGKTSTIEMIEGLRTPTSGEITVLGRRLSDGPLMFVLYLPMMLFSGIFVPRTGLNGVIAWLTHGLPMSYLVDALQRVSFRGQGLSAALWLDLAGLAVWAVVCTVVATRTWRWES